MSGKMEDWTTMNIKVFGVLTIALLVGFSGVAYAQDDAWDDLSWWGQSGATPEPVKDPERSGYWWWPTEPASNVADSELWGNRGVVYNIDWEQPKPPKRKVTPPPPPPPPKPPKVTREVPVLNHVLFDFDKSSLKESGKAEASKVVDWLKEYSKDTVSVEGHTCNIGEDAYNKALGQRRADAVAKYLVDSGVDASRVSSVSYGEDRPAVPNDSAANRKLNRRAVFSITLGN